MEVPAGTQSGTELRLRAAACRDCAAAGAATCT